MHRRFESRPCSHPSHRASCGPPSPLSRDGMQTPTDQNMLRSLESKKPAELLRLGARRAEAVCRMTAVAVADRDRAKQHLLGRHVYERPDDAVHARPGFLRAGVEPVAARQIHQGMNVAAEIGPLAGAKPAIDGDKQRHRRVEKFVIALELVQPRRGIVAVDVERA
jgi:hypothetical protein